MNKEKKKIGFKLILLSSILLPGLLTLLIIGINTKYLIRVPFFIIIYFLIVFLIGALIYGIYVLGGCEM